MNEMQYNSLKNNLKEIVCKIVHDYRQEYAAKVIYGIALCPDVFDKLSMAIITSDYIKNNINDDGELDLDVADELYNAAEESGWWEIIENEALDGFNEKLLEMLPFPQLPEDGIPNEELEEMSSALIDYSMEFFYFSYEVLDALNNEQYFKEFGDDFILLFAGNYQGSGSFAMDIKKDTKKLFEYKLEGAWYRGFVEAVSDMFDQYRQEDDER